MPLTEVELDPVDARFAEGVIGVDESLVRDESFQRAHIILVRESEMPKGRVQCRQYAL